MSYRRLTRDEILDYLSEHLHDKGGITVMLYLGTMPVNAYITECSYGHDPYADRVDADITFVYYDERRLDSSAHQVYSAFGDRRCEKTVDLDEASALLWWPEGNEQPKPLDKAELRKVLDSVDESVFG